MDIQVKLRDELTKAFVDAVLASSMIGYATSLNERHSHKEALSKARKTFMSLVEQVPEFCDGP